MENYGVNFTKEELSSANEKPLRYFNIITVIFVMVLLISNIASSAKIIDWGTSLFGLPLAFDAGTLLFPLGYVFGDILTEVYGFKRARKVIWIGFICLIFSSLIFWLVRIMPGEATWEATVGQDAYIGILGGMSSGGLVLASILGYLLGSFSNSIIMAFMKTITRSRFLWMRTIGSTLVGEFLDSAVFILIASLAQVFPFSLFWTLVITNYIFKVGIEVLMTPITYLVINGLKKVEKIDFIEDGKNLNSSKFKS
jgi:uncharacterized integral membrane protein (TIGR00697 family)